MPVPTNNGMGFRHTEDPNDKHFMLAPHLLQPFAEDIGKYFPMGLPSGTRHYRTGKTLNQGNTGTCVAHGWNHRITGAPVMQVLRMSPFDLYRIIIGRDPFTDNDFELNVPDDQLQMGTDVRTGAKVGVSLGYFKNYLWAGSIEDIRAYHLANFGGMVFGTIWKSEMMETDSEGFVNVRGDIVGGHAYATHGWNDSVRHKGKRVRALRCQQSWGEDWGDGGFFWIEEADIELLWPDGEFCAPIEVKLPTLVEVTR